MPPRFLSAQDRQQFNNFPAVIEDSDLITYFWLTPADQDQLLAVRQDSNRLGFALLLCALRYLGFFPHDLHSAPGNVVEYLAQQLGSDPAVLTDYGNRAPTRRDHQQRIMTYLGFRRIQRADRDGLLDWLSHRALENDRPSVLLQQASERLYQQRLVRPAITTLERLIVSARQRADERTYQLLAATLDAATYQQLDTLLQPDTTRGTTLLSWLRRPARGHNADDLLDALAKLQTVRAWGIDDWNLAVVPPARIQHLAQIARHSSNQALQRKAPQQRYPTLMAFLADARERLTDEILDLYDHRLAQTLRDARNDLRAHHLHLTDALQKQVWVLGQIANIVLDDAIPDSQVRPRIFDVLSRSRLTQFVAEIETQQSNLDAIHFFGSRYAYFRRFFPTLIDTLHFHPHQPPESLLQALDALRALNAMPHKPRSLYAVPTDFVPAAWRSRVMNRDGGVDRRWYELCVMAQLRDALRSGRIWVEHSRRYANLETYLIPPSQWTALRPVFLDLVPIATDGEQRLIQLQAELEAAFQRLDAQLANDAAVRIADGKLTLTPFQGEADEPSLSQQIQALLPRLQLAELLHEVDTWTLFSQLFNHGGGHTPRVDQLDRHLYAVLLAQARNIDFQQMTAIVDLSYRQLLWCNNWYVREETLQAVTNAIVNHQYRQPLSHAWGDGRLSSSDGQRFPVAVRTQNATPLPRYFGFGRGLTFLTWTSNQYSQYGTLVTPPTHREATYTLDKILDNETDLDIREHTTDTEGYTDLMFALFDLLGMQFAPRLRDLSDTQLYCLDPHITSTHIQSIITRKLNHDLILRHWDEMLHLAASLKLKWVTASLLIRKLQAFPRQHVLTTALQEYGRLIKTLFILRYVESEAYRRQIGAQLNKGEKLHALRAHLFSANRGRIRKPYPDDHLNQANCLNLIINAIITWNTVYMQAAIDHLQQHGQVISEDALAQLSPVRFAHINVHGKYSFDISVPLLNNGLRPFTGDAGTAAFGAAPD